MMEKQLVEELKLVTYVLAERISEIEEYIHSINSIIDRISKEIEKGKENIGTTT